MPANFPLALSGSTTAGRGALWCPDSRACGHRYANACVARVTSGKRVRSVGSFAAALALTPRWTTVYVGAA